MKKEFGTLIEKVTDSIASLKKSQALLKYIRQ